MSHLIARSPIHDARRRVLAYDLLYCPAPEVAGNADTETADLGVVMSAILVVGVERLAGSHFVFIPVTTALLDLPELRLLPADQVVLTLPCDASLDDSALPAQLDGLRQAGYRIALGGYRGAAPGLDALLPQLDYLRIDVAAIAVETLDEVVRGLRARGFCGQLLGEGVETIQQYIAAFAAGCAALQGPHLHRPQPVPGSALGTASTAAMQLLSALNRPNVSMRQVRERVSHDVTLTYKLLRYVSSSYFGLGEVRSVDHAMVYLGLERLRLWAMLIAMSNTGEHSHDLIECGLVRAFMCREIQRTKDEGDPDTAMIVGLLSVLDLLLDVPIERAIAELQLAPMIVEALTRHGGLYGRTLAWVLAYEHGDWEGVRDSGMDEQVCQAYFDALCLAADAIARLRAGG